VGVHQSTYLTKLKKRKKKTLLLMKKKTLNNFPGPNWHVLSFLHPIFSVQDHILSTAGDALANERSFPDWFAGSQV
jgi:hypothetical protein